MKTRREKEVGLLFISFQDALALQRIKKLRFSKRWIIEIRKKSSHKNDET